MKPTRMFAAAKKAESNDLLLYLYDDIGASFWADGVTAKGIAAAIAEAGKLDSITLRINSPGGDVFEGIAIMNLVRTQGVPVNVIIDGLAASAASVIAMAGNTITMADNSLMMIHNAWTVSAGDAAAMRKTADILDKISGTIADTYAAKSGMDAAAVRELMDAETWLNAKEAVEKGFATAIADGGDDANGAMALAASFNLKARFANVPESLAKPAPVAENQAPVAAPDLGRCEVDLLAIELAEIA